MTTPNLQIEGSGGTYILVLLTLAFLVYALGPWNWRFIKNRWAGVLIRFGRAVEHEVFGEGPVHVWWPFERLVRVPMYDLPMDVPLPDLTTAAPNPQDVSLTMQIVMRFSDPIRVILSVPDQEPTDEFVKFVQAAARSAVQGVTMDELAARGGVDKLASVMKRKLMADPVLKRWGLTIITIQPKDSDWSPAYSESQDRVVRAEGVARATLIEAEAQKKAADLIGQGNVMGLFAMLISRDQDTQKAMAQAGGLKTLVNAGSNWMDKFFEKLNL